MLTTFQPSTYQRAIFQAIEEGYRAGPLSHLVIVAAAGSGKSTTLKLLREHIPADKKILYLTFGHDVNEDLSEKIKNHTKELKAKKKPAPKASCYTIHVLGNSCLHAHNIHGDPERGKRKYNRLAQGVLKELMGDAYSYQLSEQVKALVDKVRLTLTQPTDTNLRALLQRFTDIAINPQDKEMWSFVLKAIPFILRKGIEQGQSKVSPIIDFTDQIWLPSTMALNLQPRQYDVILVDEAQDLSPCQLELVRKAVKPSGLKIYVGDPDQAIFGFAGASLRSIEEIIEAEAPRVKQLPLSICYRCPRSVVEFAAQIRPGIEPAETAEEGLIEHITNESVVHNVRPGDLILCRMRAPLVKQCLGLLRMKKRATVLGMDLGKTFEGLLDRIFEFHQQQEFHFTRDQLYIKLPTYTQGYESHEMAVLKENEEENESRIMQLEDNIATLAALYEGHREGTPFPDRSEPFQQTYQGFLDFMHHFFKEDREAQIVLSTGHKSKGMEFPRVFILSWNKLPHARAQSEDALKQEHNLMYVMVTRAKKALFLAYEPDEEEKLQSENDIINIDTTPPMQQASIASEEIISYLRGTGWKRLSAPEDDPVLLARPENLEVSVALPAHTREQGFILIATALETIAHFEQSSSILERIHEYRDGQTRCLCNTSLRSLHDLFGYSLSGHILPCPDCRDPKGIHVGETWRVCLACGSYTKTEDDVLIIGNTRTGEQRVILPSQLEETAQEQLPEKQEAAQPPLIGEPVKKKVGRPKKGAKGRVRKNCSFDAFVASYLETKEDFSNYLEEFVKTDPDFAAFLQNQEKSEPTSQEEQEEREKDPMIQVGVQVVTLACPECGHHVEARDGTQLFDAEEWSRLPQMIDCEKCASVIKLPGRSPFRKTASRKV